MRNLTKLEDGRLYGYCTEGETPGPTTIDAGMGITVEAFMVEDTDTDPRTPAPLSDISATALHVLLNPCPGDSTLTLPKTLIDLQNRALDSVRLAVNDGGQVAYLNRRDLAQRGLLHSNTSICCALPTALRLHVMSKQDMLQIMSACLYLAAGQLVIGLPDVATDEDAGPRRFKAVYVEPARRAGKVAALQALNSIPPAAYKERPVVDPSKLNRAGRRKLAKQHARDLRRKK